MSDGPHRLDAHSPLMPAIVVGFVAAVVGAVAWTLIMAFTGYEVGYAAWALGALVGFAMSRVTSRRDTTAAASAAGLAIVGLLIAKILIGEYVLADSYADALHEDDGLMAQAVMYEMDRDRSFPPEVQAEYDKVSEGDTISDALWQRILAASGDRVSAMSEDRRREMADEYAQAAFAETSLVDRVAGQLSGFDLLWILFAVSTAWGIMKHEEEDEVELESQAA